MNFRLIIILSFIGVMLSDTVEYMYVSMQLNIDATYITAALKIISLSCLLYLSSKSDWNARMPARATTFFKLFIIWNIITIIRGCFSAADYWDWKHLILETSFSLLVPYALTAGLLFDYSRDLFSLIITKIFLFGFILIPLTVKIDVDRELYARSIAIGACFFILLSPYFKTKWRLLTFMVAATSIFMSFDFRANVIRIAVSVLIISMYYIRKYIPVAFFKFTCALFFAAPLVFLYLGITNRFDIFNPTDDIEKYDYSYDNGSEKNAAADTRTFLYQEVLSSMKSKNSFAFGEGANATYKTEFFEDNTDYSKGRYGAEVGFLNTLLYCGVTGVLLYALMIFSAAYYAINYSNNFLCKMLAIFLSFRWMLFFVEDITKYNISFYFIWIAAGLCFSKGFRSLSDADIANYFNFRIPAHRL